MTTSKIPEIYRDDPNIIFVDPTHIQPDALLKSPDSTRILNNINQQVGKGQSIEEILRFVFDESKSLFECDRIGLAFLSDDNERVKSYFNISNYDKMFLDKSYSEDLKGSSLEYILKSGKSRIIVNLDDYFQSFPDSRSTRILLLEGVKSNLTSPLFVDNRIVGLLFRSSKKINAFRVEHVHTHLALADRLSQAVEKAYRIEQLKQAMDSYMEMLGFVSHEIKSPISTIIMDCKMMMEGYFGDINDKAMTRIKRIVTRGEHLLGMVREYLDLAQIEGGDLTLRSYAEVNLVDDVVKPMLEMQEAAAEQKAMTIKTDVPGTPVLINGDKGLLNIVVTNLLSNAVKYGNQNGHITIEIKSMAKGVQLNVTNEGPGFPKEQIPQLFKKFSRIQTPELLKRKGTGVGLYTVWRIVKLHGGKIKAESEEGSWARFIVDLPYSNQ